MSRALATLDQSAKHIIDLLVLGQVIAKLGVIGLPGQALVIIRRCLHRVAASAKTSGREGLLSAAETLVQLKLITWSLRKISWREWSSERRCKGIPPFNSSCKLC